jgi:hypothetical protein
MQFKASYLGNNQSITFSGLNSLASGSTVFSSAIDNTTNLDLDALVSGSFTTNAAGTSSTGTISIIVAASADGGSTYATNVNNCKVLAVLTANANGTVYALDPASVAALYGGMLPSHFKIGVTNNTGAALNGSGNSMFYEREAETVSG